MSSEIVNDPGQAYDAVPASRITHEVPDYDPALYGESYVQVDGETLQLVSYYDDDPRHEPLTLRIIEGLRDHFVEKKLLKPSAEPDNVRGPNVQFMALVTPETGVPVASLRLIHAPDGDVYKLPSFRKFAEANAFDPAALTEFRQIAAGRPVLEIARLWKDDAYSTRAKILLYRAALQQAYLDYSMWFMGIVPSEYRGITSIYGDQVVRIMGKPIPVAEEHAMQSIRLRPVFLNPRLFYFDLLDQAEDAFARGDEQTALIRMGAFWDFLRGLNLANLDAPTRKRLEERVHG